MPPTSVQVTFEGTDAEAKGVFDGVVVKLGGESTLFQTVEIPIGGGRVVVTVGASNDVAAASGGTFTLAALRLAGVSDDEWGRVMRAIKRVPFTPTERAAHTRQMPLTTAIPGIWPGRPLEGFSAIVTIHHMTDFLVLTSVLLSLGLDEAHVTVIDKEYRYLYTDRVDATLEAMGIAVERYSDIEGAIERHLDRASARHERTILIDDGGYLLPVIFHNFDHRLNEIFGLVEQTTSGIWKLRPFEAIPTPIFSVAESRVKATIESRGVTAAGFHNLCRLLPNEMWDGRQAAVIGLGRLGGELIQVLRDEHMRVVAYDLNPVELARAQHRGFDTFGDLLDLLDGARPMVIFGCTGGEHGPALTREHFEMLRRDAYLVSFTSRDYEFDINGLKELAVDSWSCGVIGTAYELPSGVIVTAVADGYPINFHYAESMPNRYSDLILASMAYGACVLADPDCSFEPGHNVKKTDDGLEASPLLKLFYELYR